MKIIKKVVLVMVLLIIMLTTSIYAADISLKAGISSNKQTVNTGEEVVLTISLKDFEGTGNGVNGFEATLNYDKDIFEEIELEESGNTSLDIDSLNRWDVPTFNPDNNKLATTKGAFVNTDESIIQITLTVKSDAQIGNTTISLLNIAASDGTDLTQVPNASVTIQVVSQQENPPQNEPEDPPKNPIEDESNNTISTIDGGNNYIDKNDPNIVMSGSLPQTGVSSILAVALTIITINAVIAFIKYKNTK